MPILCADWRPRRHSRRFRTATASACSPLGRLPAAAQPEGGGGRSVARLCRGHHCDGPLAGCLIGGGVAHESRGRRVLARARHGSGRGDQLIELVGVEKTYRMGRLDYPALRGVDLVIGAGELVAVVGPSGSGKTTILNLVAGIDRPTAGTVTVDGRRIDVMSEEELAVWRGEHVGVVFTDKTDSTESTSTSSASTADAHQWPRSRPCSAWAAPSRRAPTERSQAPQRELAST